jgi:hypothetical protein
MTKEFKIGLEIAIAAIIVAFSMLLPFFYLPHQKPIWLKGAVIVQDADTRDRLPIADVAITVSGAEYLSSAKSDSSGYFAIQLPPSVRRGRAVTLQFRHPDYQPLDRHDFVSNKLFIAEMAPLAEKGNRSASSQVTTVGSLRVRYSTKATSEVNIGSAAKPFQVVNAGNVPCKHQPPCSPDGNWKAVIGSTFLDAGAGNEFRNARVSCIAGPCPFTKIEKDNFSKGGQIIRVSARNWSDTTTFLLEAEVFHSMISEIVHESQPVIFGRALDFTLPPSAEGVCIQAEMNGHPIIYPLGPALSLGWANCEVTVNQNESKVYRCNLKAGYQFPVNSAAKADQSSR